MMEGRGENKRAYSGSNDGWTLRPPYLAWLSSLAGTKRPKETAMMRLMGSPAGWGI